MSFESARSWAVWIEVRFSWRFDLSKGTIEDFFLEPQQPSFEAPLPPPFRDMPEIIRIRWVGL